MNNPHALKLEPPPASASARSRRRVDWALAVPVLLSVGLALAGARLALHVPDPLLAFLGVTFLVWSLVFWSLGPGRHPGAVHRRTAAWLGPWLAAAVLALGLVYWVDRAGWLWFRLTGYNTQWPEDLAAAIDLGRADFLARHPAFQADPRDPARILLPSGRHDFGDTVVVPRGVALEIAPGAVLRFGAGRSLIAYGPLAARGTAQDPIVFTARHPWLKWGVVGVVGAGPAVFEHTRFEHGRQARVNAEDFVGGLSLVGTEAEIADSRFGPMFGKDALYVRGGAVDIHDNVIQDAFKDGIDFDGGGGELRANRFVDCGDEGIDLSGELDLEVRDNVVFDDRGGRIAAEQGLDELLSHNEVGFSEDHP